MTTSRKEELYADSANIELAAELLDASLKAYVSEQSGASSNGVSIKLDNVSADSKEVQELREIFKNITVVDGGSPYKRSPKAKRTSGKLEVLRQAVQTVIKETIECPQNDWVVVSAEQKADGETCFKMTVSSDEGQGGYAFVLDWLDTLNYLFEDGLVGN